MNSIFDEEETFIARRPVLSKMFAPIPIESNTSITIGSVMTDLTYRTPSEKQKRSKFEAGARATQQLGRLKPISKIPFFRPYFYALGGLSYGVILIDPLDRLEGTT